MLLCIHTERPPRERRFSAAAKPCFMPPHFSSFHPKTLGSQDALAAFEQTDEKPERQSDLGQMPSAEWIRSPGLKSDILRRNFPLQRAATSCINAYLHGLRILSGHSNPYFPSCLDTISYYPLYVKRFFQKS